MQHEYNASAWGHESILNFFDKKRITTTDIYPSEWFFIKKKLTEGMTILDIGCAKGGMANVLAENLTTFHYVGVDINPDMILAAQQRHPQHEFYHVNEADYSVLKSKRFDLVLCLGILHLHESWRDTIAMAWQYAKSSLILDLRESYLPTIEDKKISYMRMDFDNPENPNSDYRLPYNIINTADALKAVHEICSSATHIAHYGYFHPVSQLAVCPVPKLMTNAYCIEK